MKYAEAIVYLTRCADGNGTHWDQGRPWDDVASCPTCHGTNDASHLLTPGSRYGSRSGDVAPIVYRAARIDGSTSAENLDYWMGLAVNDSSQVETIIQDHAATLAGANVDAMVEGYLACQLWAQLDMDRDDDGNSPTLDENYSRDDVADEYVVAIRAEFAELVAEHPLAVRMYLTRGDYRDRYAYNRNELFGHDFYLTREGHGAGFWDRGLGELGEYLTKDAEMLVASRARRRSSGRTTWATPYYPARPRPSINREEIKR